MSTSRDREPQAEARAEGDPRGAAVAELLAARKGAVRRLALHLVRTAILVNVASVLIIGLMIENLPQEADEVGPFLGLSWIGVNLFMLGRSRKRSAPARELRSIDADLARFDP